MVKLDFLGGIVNQLSWISEAITGLKHVIEKLQSAVISHHQ